VTALVGVVRLLPLSPLGKGGRISTEEVCPMTEANAGTSGGVKTLGIKLPDELHAQLVLIAGLDGMSLTEAIRAAIDGYIERKRGEGDLAARAAQALAEIERDAAMRRDALQSLFGSPTTTAKQAAAAEPDKPTTRRGGGQQTP
jgi:hypothetical protein